MNYHVSSLYLSDWTISHAIDVIKTHGSSSHPATFWKYSAAPPKDILPVFSHRRDSWPLASLSLRSSTPCNDSALDSSHPPSRLPSPIPPASPPENVRLTAKVTRSNAPTPRSLFRVAGSRTNNICRALILNPRERRRFDPRSPEPPVSLSTLVCTSNHLPTYLIMILRYATPFPGESDGAAPLLHMARARYMGYVGSQRREEGWKEKEGWLSLATESQNTLVAAWRTYARSRHDARGRGSSEICSCVW